MSLQYNTLDRSKHEIRLIRFLRNNKIPIEISLSTAFIDEHPRYHCLSYVWGNPASVYPIVVDGVEILVNRNLGEALQRIEGEDDVEFLWADALCINQKNEVEKMHQVQMMDRIYEEANAVLAWLGPEVDSSGEVLGEVSRVGGILLRKLFNVPYPSNRRDDLRAAMKLGPQKTVMLMLKWIPVLTDPERTGRPKVPDCWADIGWGHSEHRLSIEACTAFFSRPYWRRVWILQELATARNSYLLCGFRKVPLEQLCALVAFAANAMSLVPLPEAERVWITDFHNSVMMNAPILQWIIESIQNPINTKSDLLDLLNASRSMDATVPQDRVFALSALAVNDQKIDLDYSKTLQEHLTDITRNNFLRLGFRFKPINISKCPWASGSPSWVANHPRIQDLNIIHKAQNMYYAIKTDLSPRQISRATPDFRAGGQVPWVSSQQNFPRPDILRLPCQVLGRINEYRDLRPTEDELERNRIIHDRAVSSPMPTDGSTVETAGIKFWLVALSALRKLVSFLSGSDSKKLSDLNFLYDHYRGDQLVRQFGSLTLCPGEDIPDAPQDFYRERDKAFYVGFDTLCASELLFNRADDIEDWTASRRAIGLCSYFASCIQLVCHNRFVFETSNNHIGLGPDNLELGDYIIILPGTSTPQLARPVTAGLFELIGEIYIPGVMYGEGFNIQENDDSQIWMEFC